MRRSSCTPTGCWPHRPRPSCGGSTRPVGAGPRWTGDPDGSWRRLERFETNFVDLAGTGGLLGQTAGRTSAAVVAWLDARGEDWKATVQVVAIDPCAAYRTAVEHALPHARIVADRFHLIRLANQMVAAGHPGAARSPRRQARPSLDAPDAAAARR
jgi:hypothetical protein